MRSHALRIYYLVMILLVLPIASTVAKEEPQPEVGRRYALVLGINDYSATGYARHLHSTGTCIVDSGR
jgi:hypothetical protein